MDEIKVLAKDLADWLSSKDGVTAVQRPVFTEKAAATRRLPFRRPGPAAPAFEIRFTFKGLSRRFRYVIENPDDLTTMKNTLRVHTSGELLVLVPDGPAHVMPNDIYYGNRSVVASAFGQPAPSR